MILDADLYQMVARSLEPFDSYSPPPMDEAIREELQDFVGRRKAEGGVPTDY